MSGEAAAAGHNGDIWPRPTTKHGAIPAAKIVLFLLGISIKYDKKGRRDAPFFLFCVTIFFHLVFFSFAIGFIMKTLCAFS